MCVAICITHKHTYITHRTHTDTYIYTQNKLYLPSLSIGADDCNYSNYSVVGLPSHPYNNTYLPTHAKLSPHKTFNLLDIYNQEF